VFDVGENGAKIIEAIDGLDIGALSKLTGLHLSELGYRPRCGHLIVACFTFLSGTCHRGWQESIAAWVPRLLEFAPLIWEMDVPARSSCSGKTG